MLFYLPLSYLLHTKFPFYANNSLYANHPTVCLQTPAPAPGRSKWIRPWNTKVQTLKKSLGGREWLCIGWWELQPLQTVCFSHLGLLSSPLATASPFQVEMTIWNKHFDMSRMAGSAQNLRQFGFPISAGECILEPGWAQPGAGRSWFLWGQLLGDGGGLGVGLKQPLLSLGHTLQ